MDPDSSTEKTPLTNPEEPNWERFGLHTQQPAKPVEDPYVSSQSDEENDLFQEEQVSQLNLTRDAAVLMLPVITKCDFFCILKERLMINFMYIVQDMFSSYNWYGSSLMNGTGLLMETAPSLNVQYHKLNSSVYLLVIAV